MRSLAAVVRDFVVLVVIAPVRDGRLRPERWPVGLAPVVVVALLGYVLAIAGAVFGGVLRAGGRLVVSSGENALSMPAGTAGAVLALVVVCVALLQTAALHTPWWLTAAATLFTSLLVLVVASRESSMLVSPSRVVALVAVAGVWVLVGVRRRRRFAWGEFAIVLVLVAAGVGVPVAVSTRSFASVGLDYPPLLLAEMLQTIGLLAFPAALAAGAAVVQLSCAMATASVASIRRHLPLTVGAVLLGLLVVWRLVSVVLALAAGDDRLDPPALVSSAVLLALLVGAWLLLRLVRRDRRGAHSAPPAADALESGFGALAPRIAALLVVVIVPAVFLYLGGAILFALTFDDLPAGLLIGAGDVLASDLVVRASRLAIGLLLVAAGFVRARAGATVVPELLVAVGVVTTTSAAAGLVGATQALWTGPAFLVVVTVATTALLGVWTVRRSLTAGRATAGATVLLVAALFDQRTFVEDPLRVVFGFAGAGFVVFGFLWSLLTGGRDANGTSRAFPRPSRVLLYLASALFGVTVLAFAALVRDPGATIDLSAPAALGEDTLGTGLLAAVVVTSLAAAALDRVRVSSASTSVPAP